MSARSASDYKTLSLSVANTGFMLDRLGMDCDPLQFLRELTQNAIESIQRTPEKTGQILWDVDWVTYDLEGLYKLSITDTGDGMTGEDMNKYINSLSSSSSIQSHVANFGVGAKISAATRNHAGLVYLSWKDGVGSMIHFWKDPQTGEYGLKQLEHPDGSFGHWAKVDNDIKPQMISTHGTKAILMGNSGDENTMQAPAGASSPSRWVTRYLNTRYFRFPEGIAVKCREGWEHDRSDKDRNITRTIVGQSKYLDEHKQSSGTIDLPSARIHWWILKDESAISQNSGYINSTGHCAALWQNELYEMTSGRANTASLQAFGIVFGYNRVVLYAEPKTDTGVDVFTNTARTTLLIGNRPLPWAEWQEEFKKNMPPQIVELMEEVAAAADKSDHSSSIKDRLKQVEELYKLSRYRATKTGSLLVGGESKALGGSIPASPGGTGGIGSSGGAGNTAGKTSSVYALFLASDGQPGTEVKPDIFPAVKWISVANGTRPVGDMEDRAAKYLLKDNLLLMNADFRAFTDMIKRYEATYSHVPGVKPIIEEVVKEWFEQSLVELVISSNALRGAQHWDSDHVDRLLSEEGLTAAVMPRYHIDQSIKRTLGTKLGAAKNRVA